jgi:multidrug efflux system membrane fusion protein
MERHTLAGDKMTRDRHYIIYGLIGILIIAVAVAFYFQEPVARQNAGRRGGNQGPVPVLVAPVTIADVPVYLDGVGTTKALNTVTVRPQVDGKLIKVSFKEGDDVPRGYVLGEIDPTTYQAQYDQTVAKKAQDEAQLANARLDLERYTRLSSTNAATKQQLDTQRALVAQLEAQVRLDQAAIDNAAAILGYTKIVAPIAGRTGIRQIDQGNIVHATDTGGLVVLTQVKPISVLFNLPQQVLGRVNKAFSQGPLAVEALSSDNINVADRGTLQVVDNQVDQTTGTVKLKADFPNADLALWPGQFVNVRLLIDTLKQAIVVPTAAVQRGPNGAFVYVVNGDLIAVRQVSVTQQDEARAVIGSGLSADERVVTTGFSQLANGSQIIVSTTDNKQPPTAGDTRTMRKDGERKRRDSPGAQQSR